MTGQIFLKINQLLWFYKTEISASDVTI